MTSSQRSAYAPSRATTSSSKSSKEEPIFLDPTDDATFQSLKKLLSAPSTSTQHLSLLSEGTLYGSITYYLSKLQLEHVADFARVINASGCLWTPPPPASTPPTATSASGSSPNKLTWTTEPGSPSNTSDKSSNTLTTTSPPNAASRSASNVASSLSAFLIARSTNISQAVAAALTKRVDLIVRSKNNRTGWRARSSLSQFLGAILQGMDDTERDATPESYRAARGLPIPRFAIIGGLLNSLYVLKDQRRRLRDMSILEEMAALRSNPSLGLSVRHALGTIEDEWIVTLAEILDHLHGQTTSSDSVQASSATDSSEHSDRDVDEWEAEFRKRTASVAGPASITSLASKQTLRAALSDVRDVPLYMAAQLAPFVPDRKIHALDPIQLTSATSDAILSLFEGPHRSSFLSSLAQDVHTQTCGDESDPRILVDPNGATGKILQGVMESTLFPLLGPLSKLMSRALAKAVTSLTPEELSALLLGTTDAALVQQSGEIEFFPMLVRMSRLSSHLEASWLSSPLAGANEDQIVEASRQLTKQLWTSFKTLLFSYTMVFDSMMDALVDMCPSPTLTVPPPTMGAEGDADRKWPRASTSNLPVPYLVIVQHVLATYSHLYWITSTFGSDGFDVYRKVFYSALDVIGRDGEACIQLLELIAPITGAGDADGLEMNTAKRSATTYFLNVAEQLIRVLPDQVVEELVLPVCRPYLENTRFSDTFESAHSVVLAMYASHKRCILNLAPFYVDLVLASFPTRLNSVQLEYALSTVVGAISDRSDSVAWWVITRIAEEIDRERLSAKDGSKEAGIQAGGFAEGSSGVTKADLDSATASSDSVHPSAATTSAERDGGDTHDRLTHLQMCLIACIPSVNLVLLRSALSKVESFILLHKQRELSGLDAAGAQSSRLALCQKTFDAIQALNAATREEGLRWWLDQRARFGV
ncbi:hypothetical protein EX895_001793 [Sporisorium graminicola]|uniref:Uncharacterized protein n=1 Tax=Sporisorium graminicola TaxID=280036 RepID=A0A4U7L1X4_9BASI|nr:hypothetical protein EX895_001793 [Sporisorium graminicola]TKY89262.1 hypothetical protein EX895_001793 [Sporisorium graminicola]